MLTIAPPLLSMLRNPALQVNIEPSRLVWRTETMSSGLLLINNASLKQSHGIRLEKANLYLSLRHLVTIHWTSWILWYCVTQTCLHIKPKITHFGVLSDLLMPAVLTRYPTGPQVLLMVWKALCTSCSLETSQLRATCSAAVKRKTIKISPVSFLECCMQTSDPPPESVSTVACAASWLLEITTTRCPLCANSWATARPMPREPPNTTPSWDISRL